MYFLMPVLIFVWHTLSYVLAEILTIVSEGRDHTSKYVQKAQQTILTVYHHECTHLPALPANHTRPFGRMIVVSVGYE